MNLTAIRSLLLLLVGLGAVLFIARPNLPLGAVLALLVIIVFLPELTPVDTLINQGNNHFAKGDYRTAFELYNRVIRKQPRSAVAYYNRGIIHALQNDPDLALEDFERTIQFDPNFAQAYAERGIIHLDWGRHSDALKDCDRALQLNPQYARAYFGRGAARSYQGDIEGAIADFSQQLQLQPTAAIHYNIAVLQLFTDQYEPAIASLTHALRLDPNFASAYYNRGNARYAIGDESGALADYHQGMQLETSGKVKQYPNDEHGYYGRGVARSRMGDREGAITDLQHAAQLCQQHQSVRFHQQVLATLAELQA